MKRGFTLIAWGLAFVLINFRIQSFDLLPDTLGFALILGGLQRLRDCHGAFRAARVPAWLLLGASIFPLLGHPLSVSLIGGNDSPDAAAMALAAGCSAVQLWLMYGLCRGIQGVALNARNTALARTARICWQWLFALTAAMLFILPFNLNVDRSNLMFPQLLFVVGGFAVGLCILAAAVRAGRELNGTEGIDGQV